jgi:hypothetical protein
MTLPPGWVKFGNHYVNLNLVPRIDFDPVNQVAVLHYQENQCDTTATPTAVTNLQTLLNVSSIDVTTTTVTS